MLALLVGMGLFWLPAAARRHAHEEFAEHGRQTSLSPCLLAIRAAHPELAHAPGIGDTDHGVERMHYLAGGVRSFECMPGPDGASVRAIATPLSDDGGPGWIMNADGSATLVTKGGTATLSPNRSLVVGGPPPSRT